MTLTIVLYCQVFNQYNFLNGPTPISSLFIFGLFKQTIQFLQQIISMSCPSSKWHWDSNPRPFERQSPPITTRPGLPPSIQLIYQYQYKSQLNLSYVSLAKQFMYYRYRQGRRISTSSLFQSSQPSEFNPIKIIILCSITLICKYLI